MTPEELYQEALRYHNGDGVEKDYIKALYWYRQAAKQNDALAMTQIGYYYENVCVTHPTAIFINILHSVLLIL